MTQVVHICGRVLKTRHGYFTEESHGKLFEDSLILSPAAEQGLWAPIIRQERKARQRFCRMYSLTHYLACASKYKILLHANKQVIYFTWCEHCIIQFDPELKGGERQQSSVL